MEQNLDSEKMAVDEATASCSMNIGKLKPYLMYIMFWVKLFLLNR